MITQLVLLTFRYWDLRQQGIDLLYNTLYTGGRRGVIMSHYTLLYITVVMLIPSDYAFQISSCHGILSMAPCLSTQRAAALVAVPMASLIAL